MNAVKNAVSSLGVGNNQAKKRRSLIMLGREGEGFPKIVSGGNRLILQEDAVSVLMNGVFSR